MESYFPYVKIISAEDLIGTSTFFKVQYILKTFEDAYKSPRSLIILDDLERLIEYVDIGKRFSNDLLQTLLVLLKRLPDKQDSGLFVIATCTNQEILSDFGFDSLFNVKIQVNKLKFGNEGENEIAKVFEQYKQIQIKDNLGLGKDFSISVKNLILSIQLMDDSQGKSLKEQFKDALEVLGQNIDLRIQ